MSRLNRIAFEAVAWTRLRKYLYYRYDYAFAPQQLGFLVDALDRTASLSGAVLEIGCAYGHTTAYLNRHLDSIGDKRRYVCVDTFAGFTEEDASYEEQERGKRPGELRGRFADASLRNFNRTMANNGITRVDAIRADVSRWDPASVASVSFCLIDVDLYLPVAAALKKIVPLVEPGGIVIVDDCQKHELWDGALQAYLEFMASLELPPRIVEGKLGVIEVPG